MRIADTLIIDILNAYSGIELSQCHVCLRVAIATAVLWLFSRTNSARFRPIGMLSLRSDGTGARFSLIGMLSLRSDGTSESGLERIGKLRAR